MAEDRPDDRDRDTHGIAGLVGPMAVPPRWPEIHSYRYRSVGNAKVYARRSRGRRCAGRHARAAGGGQKGPLRENEWPPRRDPRGLGGGTAPNSKSPAADGLLEYSTPGTA